MSSTVNRKKEGEGLSSEVYRRAGAWQKGKQAWWRYMITEISNACPGLLGGVVGELPLMASAIARTTKKERGKERLTCGSRGAVRGQGQ